MPLITGSLSLGMQIKPIDPKLTQKQIAKETGYYDSTIKRYRTDINLISAYLLHGHK